MKNHIWMLSCRYKCKSCVGPIWWIIDYPASLEHRTNRLDVGREWRNRQEIQQTSTVTLNSASTIALSWTSTSNSMSNYYMMIDDGPLLYCVYFVTFADIPTWGKFCQKVRIGSELEHKTCDILAAERLRLMRFDNRLIIDSFEEHICILIQ